MATSGGQSQSLGVLREAGRGVKMLTQPGDPKTDVPGLLTGPQSLGRGKRQRAHSNQGLRTSQRERERPLRLFKGGEEDRGLCHLSSATPLGGLSFPKSVAFYPAGRSASFFSKKAYF